MNIVLLVAVAAGALIGIGVGAGRGRVGALRTRSWPTRSPLLDERTAHHFTHRPRADPVPTARRGGGCAAGCWRWCGGCRWSVADRRPRLLGLVRGPLPARPARPPRPAYAAAGPVLAVTAARARCRAAGRGAGRVHPARRRWSAGPGYARRVRDRAEEPAIELRYALVAYLTPGRAAAPRRRRGGHRAARCPRELLDDSWAMRRLADQLELAERGRADALGRAAPVRHPDRARRARPTCPRSPPPPARTAARSSTPSWPAPTALNDELLADAHAAANRATGQMSTPGALQVFLIAAWVLYPAALALLTA